MEFDDSHHTCAECGHTVDIEDFQGDEGGAADAAGVLACPNCGYLDWGD